MKGTTISVLLIAVLGSRDPGAGAGDAAQPPSTQPTTQPVTPKLPREGAFTPKTVFERHYVVRIDGHSWEVEGVSWMDREFSSNQLTEQQKGWDWFGLRLDDGRDLMLYQLRREDGSVDYGKGTLVTAEGEVRYLAKEDWKLEVTDRWKSPDSGIVYPGAWTVALPSEGLRLSIEPDVADQENRSRAGIGMTYWEGAVTVHGPDGQRAGDGYAELTGYGENNRPPI